MKRIILLAGPVLLSTICLLSNTAFSEPLIGVEIAVPSIRLLSVGVSKYKGREFNSPAPDAQRLATTFASIEGRVRLKSALVVTDSQATKIRIIEEYRNLVSQASPDELVIFFFTGFADELNSRIYLIPSDFPEALRISDRLAEEGIDLQQDIIQPTPPDKKVLIIVDGCHVGDGSLGTLMDEHPQLAILASSKADEVAVDSTISTPFVSAIVDVLKNPNSDIDGDHQLSVEELYIQLYTKMVRPSVGFYIQQHPSLVGLRSHRLMLANANIAQDKPTTSVVVTLDLPQTAAFAQTKGLSINGEPLEEKVQYRIADGNLTFLGSGTDFVNAGINLLTIGRQQFYLWKVGESLKLFRNPYQNSRAIIVAIDDYDRREDPLRRGPTGFAQLTGMVDNAKKLKSALVSLGFPEEGITELYNKDATLKKFEDELESFWVGGVNASADRLLVYFGGHGDDFQNNNLLVTYDYEQPRRLMTTFQAKDLVERHSRNIQANHVLFAIDVCYAGLVFLGPDDVAPTNAQIAESERLALIERDVSERARNVIVAGTGDQRALSENGGIFTRSLIEGLQGKADPANSGVIQFDQLGIYVKDRVTATARINGYRQVPDYSSLREFGQGRIMFIRPMSKR